MTTFIAKPSIARKRAYGGGMLKGALSPIQVNERNPFGTVDPYLQSMEKLALAIMAGRENRQAANIEAEQAANKAAFTQSILGGISIPPNVVNPRPTGPISGRLASLGDFLLGKRVTRPEAYASLVGNMEGTVMPRALAGTFAHGAGVDPLQAAKIQAELAPDIPDPAKWTKVQVDGNDALFNETTRETFVQAIMPNGEPGFFNNVTGKWLDPSAADRAMKTAEDGSTETPEPPMSAADYEEREGFIKELPQLQASTARTINRFSANIKEATTLLEALRANPNLYGGDKLANIFLTIWPGSKQKDIQEKLKKLKSNLGLDELKAMRDASKSGASGLGALSERELSVLESIDANLSGMQSQQQLMGELERLVTIWTQGVGHARQIYNNDFLRLEITSDDFNEQQLENAPNLLDLFRITPEAEVAVRPAINPNFENLIDSTPLGLNDQARLLFLTE
jgi:hypothetical protein